MKKLTSKIISVLCAVCMVMAVSASVFAADDTPSIWVQTREGLDKSAMISLVNVTHQIYSAQVTLKVNGENIKFEITPNDSSAYGTITQSGRTVTLYVDSKSLMQPSTKLNNQDVIKLAVLKADKAFTIGSTADLIIVDRGMKSHSYNNISVRITEEKPSTDPTETSSGGSSGGGKSPSGGQIAMPNQNQTGTVTELGSIGIDTGFDDVPLDFWANSSIKFVTQKGLFEGTSESEFDPHAQMTRGMYVTVLSRFGDKVGDSWRIECDTPAVFGDVSGDEWFAEAAMWAGGTGLVNGIDEGLFGPYYPITREQIAVMTVNFANLCSKSLVPVNQAVTFADGDSINDWAREAVMLAQCAGLIYGREDGTFAPQATATRAEVAAILTRFVQNMN